MPVVFNFEAVTHNFFHIVQYGSIGGEPESMKALGLESQMMTSDEVTVYLSTMPRTTAEQTYQGSCWQAAWQVRPCYYFPENRKNKNK